MPGPAAADGRRPGSAGPHESGDDRPAAYRELAPPPALAHVVRCLWWRVGTGDETLVLPDGCLDIVVREEHAVVAGPDTGPDAVVVPAGVAITGVRFHPGTGAAALGVPADELRDRRVPLEELWGAGSRELAERSGADPVALAALLARRLAPAAPDPRMTATARRLAHAPATSVPALAASVGLGERQLRRRFTAAVGYGPKTFARIARFRHALALLRAGGALADVAAAAGYADQAHMTRDMAALAGRTPTRLA